MFQKQAFSLSVCLRFLRSQGKKKIAENRTPLAEDAGVAVKHTAFELFRVRNQPIIFQVGFSFSGLIPPATREKKQNRVGHRNLLICRSQ
jgi:hypothetical protein